MNALPSDGNDDGGDEDNDDVSIETKLYFVDSLLSTVTLYMLEYSKQR